MVWTLVVALTAIGLAGLLPAFLGFFVTSERGFATGGCAMAGAGFLLVVFLALLLLVFVALNGVLASIGSILLWRYSRWGPLLMIPSNFLTMAVFVYLPVHQGQVVWTAVVLLFAAAPAGAVGLLIWALWTRAAVRERLVELIVLGLIGLPLLTLYVAGVSRDVTAVLTSPPQVSASATC
jgi:hypothetical protein